MKTIIAGSRHIKDYRALEAVMKEIPFKPTQIISGMAPGVDMLGVRWAQDNGYSRKDIIKVPADWDNKDIYEAGKERNTRMAEMAEACVVLWDANSPGSKDMIAKAQAYDLQLYVFTLQMAQSLYIGRVVNVNKETCDIFIGRGSPWGNPFEVGKDGTREEVIQMYADWLTTQPHLLKKLGTLRGKKLGCYCAPHPCHGDVLVNTLKHLPENFGAPSRPRGKPREDAET